MISDPSQLLQRIPELESLAAEAGIRRAIESGDPFKVYRALFRAKWLRKLPAQKTVLESLLRQRRLFARPLKGKVGLGTLNSVGFSFVGGSERDKEGVYIALHAFVILLKVPLVPLGSYLVQNQGRRGFSSHWRIFARVPMGTAGWLYSRGLTAAMAGLLVFGIFSAIWSSGHQDVTVLNAFDKPVTVVLAGKKRQIPPQGRIAINVPAGKVSGIATLDDGTVIDQLATEVHPTASNAVWNIAGAAPLFRERVVYVPEGTPTQDSSNNAQVYCGTQYVELGSADYVFQPPPRSLRMNSNQRSTDVSHIDVAAVPGQTQTTICLNYSTAKDQLAGAADSLSAIAAVRGWDWQATQIAVIAMRMKSQKMALDLAKRASDAKPDDVDVQRIYGQELDISGLADRARAEFAARQKREPSSPVAAYLGAMTYDGEEGLSKITDAARRFHAPYILRSLVWREWLNGHSENAVRDWSTLRVMSFKEASNILEAEVGAELTLHQPQQALQAIDDVFSTSPRGNFGKMMLASEYALVAGPNDANRGSLFARLDEGNDPAMIAYYRARAGFDPDDRFSHNGQMAELAMDLRDSPAGAMQIASNLTRFDVYKLAPEHWSLLFAEAVRTGDQALQDKLLGPSSLDSTARDRLKAYVQGQDVKLDGLDIRPDTRAAACLVRSENPALSAVERRNLRALAATLDVPRSVISTAAGKWPF